MKAETTKKGTSSTPASASASESTTTITNDEHAMHYHWHPTQFTTIFTECILDDTCTILYHHIGKTGGTTIEDVFFKMFPPLQHNKDSIQKKKPHQQRQLQRKKQIPNLMRKQKQQQRQQQLKAKQQQQGTISETETIVQEINGTDIDRSSRIQLQQQQQQQTLVTQSKEKGTPAGENKNLSFTSNPLTTYNKKQLRDYSSRINGLSAVRAMELERSALLRLEKYCGGNLHFPKLVTSDNSSITTTTVGTPFSDYNETMKKHVLQSLSLDSVLTQLTEIFDCLRVSNIRHVDLVPLFNYGGEFKYKHVAISYASVPQDQNQNDPMTPIIALSDFESSVIDNNPLSVKLQKRMDRKTTTQDYEDDVRSKLLACFGFCTSYDSCQQLIPIPNQKKNETETTETTTTTNNVLVPSPPSLPDTDVDSSTTTTTNIDDNEGDDDDAEEDLAVAVVYDKNEEDPAEPEQEQERVVTIKKEIITAPSTTSSSSSNSKGKDDDNHSVVVNGAAGNVVITTPRVVNGSAAQQKAAALAKKRFTSKREQSSIRSSNSNQHITATTAQKKTIPSTVPSDLSEKNIPSLVTDLSEKKKISSLVPSDLSVKKKKKKIPLAVSDLSKKKKISPVVTNLSEKMKILSSTNSSTTASPTTSSSKITPNMIKDSCCNNQFMKRFMNHTDQYCAKSKFTAYQVSRNDFEKVIKKCKNVATTTTTIAGDGGGGTSSKSEKQRQQQQQQQSVTQKRRFVTLSTYREPISRTISYIHQHCNKNTEKRPQEAQDACRRCSYNTDQKFWNSFPQTTNKEYEGLSYTNTQFPLKLMTQKQDDIDIDVLMMDTMDINQFLIDLDNALVAAQQQLQQQSKQQRLSHPLLRVPYLNSGVHNKEKLTVCSFGMESQMIKLLQPALNIYRQLTITA